MAYDDLLPHVRVRRQLRAVGERTTVRIDHRVPEARGEPERWRVRTEPVKLSSKDFGPVAADLNKLADNRGRVVWQLYLPEDEILVAASYHLDDARHVPVVMTHWAALTTLPQTIRAVELKRLRRYFHAIGIRTARGVRILADARGQGQLEGFREMGFRPASVPRGLRPRGVMLEHEG
jgi:hypothetical protein